MEIVHNISYEQRYFDSKQCKYSSCVINKSVKSLARHVLKLTVQLSSNSLRLTVRMTVAKETGAIQKSRDILYIDSLRIFKQTNCNIITFQSKGIKLWVQHLRDYALCITQD